MSSLPWSVPSQWAGLWRPGLPPASAWVQGVLLAGIAALAWFLLGLHGEVPAWQPAPAARLLLAGALAVGWVGLCLRVALGPRRHLRAGALRAAAASEAADGAGFLVVHASQTGSAQALARHTADMLAGAGNPVRVVPLAALDAASLTAARRLLLLASTTGEGDAPDGAAGFVDGVLDGVLDLSGLEFGLLALGDSHYRQFCAFGRRLDHWLRTRGARARFAPVEVDDQDPAAIGLWHSRVAAWAGCTMAARVDGTPLRASRLSGRRLLNPGSPGDACYEVTLDVPAGSRWEAGDVAEIQPCHPRAAVDAWLRASGLRGELPVPHPDGERPLAELLASARLPAPAEVAGLDARQLADRLRPLPRRDYTIASLPREGRIALLVRQRRLHDGRLGLGSGWLTAHAAPGSPVRLRLRPNPGFRVPPDDRPLILVGNGSGMAGLRALLAERVRRGHRRNWLVFGERAAHADFHFGQDILRWQREGWIERLDLAFSREPEGPRYVQDALAAAPGLLRDRVSEGADILVCGSLAGMAPGVEAVLQAVLGERSLAALRAAGRYRRDVY